MKRLILLPFLLILSLASVLSQDFGIAVQEGVGSVLLNPAALGVGDAAGLGYSQGFNTGDGMEEDLDLILSLGNLAYSYGRFHDTDKHLLAGGFRAGPGNYLGADYQWYRGDDYPREGGLTLAWLNRPHRALSLTVLGRDLNRDAFAEFGLGLRPLFFLGEHGDRLTLSWDGRVRDGEFDHTSLGAFLEPLNGLRIYGDYNFDEELFSMGINLVLSHLEFGSFLDVSGDRAWEQGRIQAYASVKRQRCIFGRGLGNGVDYDMARLITDAPSSGLFAPEGRSLLSFLRDMEEIRRDSSIKVLIFRNQRFNTSFANILEIEEALKGVKASGKEIYFYFDHADSLSYALAASVGDGVYISPGALLSLRSFGTTRLYLKDFLAEWGVKVHNFRSHDYKSAFDNLSESAMTEAEREALEYVFEDLQRELLRMIREGRDGKLSTTPQKAVDAGPFIYAARAMELGLADGILYEDEFYTLLRERRFTALRASMRPERAGGGWEAVSTPVIALIYARGMILPGEGTAGRNIGADSLAGALREARGNPLVKAIVLRVDSGGGAALSSDKIAREVALCSREGKPVVVSMGGSAASGGYYIAAPADRILASSTSLTGSIGVITILPEISGLLERFLIRADGVETGEHSRTGSILKPVTPSEEEQVRAYVAQAYDQFIRIVRESRGLSEEEIRQAARGRVWTGSQALDRGLVDELGGLSLAIETAREMGGIRGEYRLVERVPGNRSLIPSLFPAFFAELKTEESLPLPEDLESLLDMYGRLSAFREGEALYLSPYSDEELGVRPRD